MCRYHDPNSTNTCQTKATILLLILWGYNFSTISNDFWKQHGIAPRPKRPFVCTIRYFLPYMSSGLTNFIEMVDPLWIVGFRGNITKIILQISRDSRNILVVLNNVSNYSPTNRAANINLLAVLMIKVARKLFYRVSQDSNLGYHFCLRNTGHCSPLRPPV